MMGHIISILDFRALCLCAYQLSGAAWPWVGAGGEASSKGCPSLGGPLQETEKSSLIASEVVTWAQG